MNWKTQLAASLKSAPAAPTAPVVNDEAKQIAEQLRAAAAVFAARTDSFANGKADTCRDLADKLEKFGSFVSIKQADFAAKLVEWSKPRQRDEVATPQNLSVPNLFAVMQSLSTLFVGDLKVSRKNQSELCWLLWNDKLVGKLENNEAVLFRAKLAAARVDSLTVVERLREIDRDPRAAAAAYGKLSGICGCCGRDLTDPVSIEQGIGPVCRERF